MREISRSAVLSDEKRQLLIEAAIDEFVECGLKNASFNRIIERSGLSKGSVYYYFDNKDSLLSMVMEHIGRRILDAIPWDIAPATPESYWDELHNIHRRVCGFFALNPKLGQIMFMSLAEREITEDDKHGPSFSVILRRHAEMVRMGQEIGVVRSDLTVGSVIALMQAIDRTLFARIFPCSADEMMNMSGAERARRTELYLELSRDMFIRILSAPAESGQVYC